MACSCGPLAYDGLQGDGPIDDGPNGQKGALPAPASESVLGEGIAAKAADLVLSFDQLDALLLDRYGGAPEGLEALGELVDRAIIQSLAESEGLEVGEAEVNERWLELDRATRDEGVAGGLREYLEQSGVDPEEFRRLLRLSLVQEVLARRALGIPDGDPVTAEQQTAWLDTLIEVRGLETVPRPWPEGIAARCGDLVVTTDELVREVRGRLPDDTLRTACFELLLERRVLERMPDLNAETIERAVDAEIARRKAQAEANPEYGGLGYSQLLAARGLTLDVVRRDSAVRAAALSHLWVERGFDQDELRAVYESERSEFDGRFGEGVAVARIQLVAGERKNTLVPRTYEEAEDELTALRARIGGTEDFLRLAAELNEKAGARGQDSEVGVVTRLAGGLPAPLRAAVFEVLDQDPGDVSGRVLGPFRVQGAVLLVCLGARRPAPTWEEMSSLVARDLRRRFLDESLPRRTLRTWLDEE